MKTQKRTYTQLSKKPAIFKCDPTCLADPEGEQGRKCPHTLVHHLFLFAVGLAASAKVRQLLHLGHGSADDPAQEGQKLGFCNNKKKVSNLQAHIHINLVK